MELLDFFFFAFYFILSFFFSKHQISRRGGRSCFHTKRKNRSGPLLCLADPSRYRKLEITARFSQGRLLMLVLLFRKISYSTYPFVACTVMKLTKQRTMLILS